MAKSRHTQPNPFPVTIQPPARGAGAVVIDERCTCGRLRSEHADTFLYGHGPAPGCARFRSLGRVFDAPSDHRRLDDRYSVTFERASKRNVGARGFAYQVWDCGAGARPHKAFNTVAAGARSISEAFKHAAEELKLYLARKAAQASIDEERARS